MARTLTTIGDLRRATPLSRSRERRATMRAIRGGMGSATSDTAGRALTDAAYALLNHLEELGVPPESEKDPVVGAFQLAWNADPKNTGDQLRHDEQYGPLTRGALNAIVGGVAPLVNGGPSPSPTPGPAPPSPSPAPIAPATDGGAGLGFWLLVLAVGVGGYLLFVKKKKRGGARRRSGSPLVEVRSNPRRVGRRRNAELIP